MKKSKSFNYIVKLIILLLIITLLGIIGVVGYTIHTHIDLKNLQKTFREDGILICHNTLIVTNNNWKLNQDKLINNNSAGYVSLENCRIQ